MEHQGRLGINRNIYSQANWNSTSSDYCVEIIKCAIYAYILSLEASSLELDLYRYVQISLIIDIIAIFASALLKYHHSLYCLGIFLVVLVLPKFIWQIPGSLWFLACDGCFHAAPALTVLSLLMLITMWFRLLLLCLVTCLSMCLFCLASNSTPALTGPGTEEMIEGLKIECFSKELFNVLECVICSEEYIEGANIIVLKCDRRHYFHDECAKKWLRTKAKCPFCSASVRGN